MITLRYADIILTAVAMCAVVFTTAAISAMLMLRSTSRDIRQDLNPGRRPARRAPNKRGRQR